MSCSETLVRQAAHHFRWLSKAIRDVTLEQARFEVAAGRPSIAWQVGHLTAGADSLGRAVAGLEPLLPPDFLTRHGSPHWAVADGADWNDLRAVWERTSRAAQQGLEHLTDEDLELPPATEILPEFTQQLATRQAFLAGEVFHFAYHLGQIGTLRAALDLGWA